MEERKDESNSNLLLGLGGRATIVHFFLVLHMCFSLGSSQKQTNKISSPLFPSLPFSPSSVPSPPPPPPPPYSSFFLFLFYKKLSHVILDAKRSQKSILRNLEIQEGQRYSSNPSPSLKAGEDQSPISRQSGKEKKFFLIQPFLLIRPLRD